MAFLESLHAPVYASSPAREHARRFCSLQEEAITTAAFGASSALRQCRCWRKLVEAAGIERGRNATMCRMESDRSCRPARLARRRHDGRWHVPRTPVPTCTKLVDHGAPCTASIL